MESLRYGMSHLSLEQLEARPEPVKEFHHKTLFEWLVLVGVPAVTPTTVPLILERIRLINSLEYNRAAVQIRKSMDISILVLLQTYFMGYCARVHYVKNGAFTRRIFNVKDPKDSGAIYDELQTITGGQKQP